MRTTLATILSLAITATALAQPVTPRTLGQTGGRTAVKAAPTVDFESLFQLDADGNPTPLEGPADLAALKNNTLISPEAREALKPTIDLWLAKIERLTSENIDLVVKLDTSALKNFNLKETDNLMFINDAVAMLSSAGSLTDYLASHDALTDEQAQQKRRIVNDFQRSMIMFVAEKAQKANPNDIDSQLRDAMTGNYRESLRDVFWTYSRILKALAGSKDAMAATLGDAASKVKTELDAVATTTGDAQIDAVRTLLSKLDYPDQRELAELALRLDPTSVARDGGQH
jgi:hypothetical protein